MRCDRLLQRLCEQRGHAVTGNIQSLHPPQDEALKLSKGFFGVNNQQTPMPMSTSTFARCTYIPVRVKALHDKGVLPRSYSDSRSYGLSISSREAT